MPKDREKSINPAAAARKAEKQKAVKRGKAAVQAQRNERLAQRNPHRLQRQIDDLKALESSGSLNARDKKQLEDLERDLKRVHKAKDAVGDKYDRARNNADRDRDRDRDRGVLGKRLRQDGHGRDGGGREGRYRNEERQSESSETDESVRNIPMPRDTPPPVPRPSRARDRDRQGHRGRGGLENANANATPLGEGRGTHALPERPPAVEPAQAQTVYEAKPVMRDLRREAAAFVPAAVRRNVGGGGGRKEGAENKERGGYGDLGQDASVQEGDATREAAGEGADDAGDVEEDMRRLQEEEERWRREMKQAHVEEVEDEEA